MNALHIHTLTFSLQIAINHWQKSLILACSIYQALIRFR